MTIPSTIRFLTGLLAIACGLVAYTAPASGQALVLPGQVIDLAGRPVAGMEVVLHQVTEGGGAIITQDTSGPDGMFELRTDDAPADAVYFVATRYEGQLHIGPMLRAPFPTDQEYVLRVGTDPAAPRPIEIEDAVRPPLAGPERQGVVLLVMGGLLVLGGAAMLRARRPPEERRLLVRLAELDSVAGAKEGADELERSRILARLRHGGFR